MAVLVADSIEPFTRPCFLREGTSDADRWKGCICDPGDGPAVSYVCLCYGKTWEGPAFCTVCKRLTFVAVRERIAGDEDDDADSSEQSAELS